MKPSSVISAARKRLCATCLHEALVRGKPDCNRGLIPVTKDGQDCPFWTANAEIAAS